VLHLHDEDGLKGVDGFLSELPLLAHEAMVHIGFHEVFEILEGADVGQEAVVRGLPYLGLAIAEVGHHGLEKLALDVELDVTGVKVDDFEGEGACQEVDVFLRKTASTVGSSISSWMPSTILLAYIANCFLSDSTNVLKRLRLSALATWFPSVSVRNRNS
jgi:hypothetical protein